MRKRFLLRIATAALLAGAAVTGPGALKSHASLPVDMDTAYCPPTSVNGAGSWTPGVTVVPQPNVVSMTITAQCPFVTIGEFGSIPDDGGTYGFSLSGVSDEDCVAGWGHGTLSGSGPEGLLSGVWSFYKGGVHYYINGNFFSGGEWHNLQLWVDALADVTSGCFYNTSSLIGHGAVADSAIAISPLPTP